MIVPRQTARAVRENVDGRQMAAGQDEAAERQVTPQVRVGPAAGVGDNDDEGEKGRRVTAAATTSARAAMTSWKLARGSRRGDG
jgi:hypothetical protein